MLWKRVMRILGLICVCVGTCWRTGLFVVIVASDSDGARSHVHLANSNSNTERPHVVSSPSAHAVEGRRCSGAGGNGHVEAWPWRSRATTGRELHWRREWVATLQGKAETVAFKIVGGVARWYGLLQVSLWKGCLAFCWLHALFAPGKALGWRGLCPPSHPLIRCR